MATITQQIPNYHGGISQQADEVKAPGQVNKLKNAIPDVVQGLTKRPGTKLLTTGVDPISGNIDKINNDKWFHYYRDENEQYIGRIDRSTGDIRMWGKDGTEKNVLYDNTDKTAIENYLRYPYADDSNPVPTEDELQTLTINDFTYLTNRNKTVLMDTAATTDDTSGGYNPVRPPEAYIELKKVAYARQYAVNLFDDNTTQDVTTATRISIPSSRLDSYSTCPNVGTEIFNVGTEDDVHENVKQEFQFKAIHGNHEGDNNFFETDLTLNYRLHYCPPEWTANTFYRPGDLVTGRPDSNNSNAHQSVYKLKAGSKSDYSKSDGSAPSHDGTTGNEEVTVATENGDGTSTANGHTWVHVVSDSFYTADEMTFANPAGNDGDGSGGTSQIHHLKPCITLLGYKEVDSQDRIEELITAWKNLTDNPKYADLPFVFDDQEKYPQENSNSNGYYSTEIEFGIIWKHFGYYDDHIDRIILQRTGGTGPTIDGIEVRGKTIGGSYADLVTGVGQFELKTTGWSKDTVLGDGRSDLYFRITNTGQAIPDSTGDNYTCRYTTTVDLLHGGSGWQVGDRIRVKLKGGTHVIQVDKTSIAKEQANLALVRPTPTSFDTKTTVTAESIIGSIRQEIVATNNFTDSEVTQVGNGLYVTINKTVRTLASISNDFDNGTLLSITQDANGLTSSSGKMKFKFTSAHGLSTGDAVKFIKNSHTIDNLTDGEVYYAIKIDDESIELAPTRANALDGTNKIAFPTTGDSESIPCQFQKAIGLLITITGHEFGTGRKVKYNFTSGSVVPGLSNDAYYHVIRKDANSFWLATSFDNATAGTKISHTGALPVGSAHTFTPEQTFGISTSDGDLLNVFTNEIQDVADLPSQCKHGYKIKVRNSDEEADDYYLKFEGQEKQDGTFLDGKGIWEECAEPGRDVRLDYSTMPVGLIRTADGHFRVTQFDGTKTHIIYFPEDAFTALADEETITFDGQTFESNGSDNITTYVAAMNDGSTVSDKLGGTSTSSGGVESGYHFAVSGNNVVVTEKPVSTYTFPTLTTSSFAGPSGHVPTKVDSLTVPTWADCTVGSWDSTEEVGTVPEPSFVNNNINKVISFRNRLGILSDENVNLSRPGKFFDFWAISAIAYAAGDNIDVSCSSTHPAILYDALQINAGLLLFSENEQFMLTTDSDVLSPLTAKVNSFCTYNFNKNTKPISLGTTVGFLDNASRYSRFFEITSLLREGQPEVFEQSKIVSKLLPKDLTLITNSRENSTIFFTARGSNTIYGLRYLTGGDRRLQQAWFTWEMSSPVQHMALMDDELYLVLRDNFGDATTPAYKDTIQKITLRLGEESNHLYHLGGAVTSRVNIKDDDVIYPVHLDNCVRIEVGSLNDTAVAGYTTFNIPTGFNKTNLAGTYGRSEGEAAIVRNSHGFKVGQKLYFAWTKDGGSGDAPTDGEYTIIEIINADAFKVTADGEVQTGTVLITTILGAVEAHHEEDYVYNSDWTVGTTTNGQYGKITPYDDSGTLKGKVKGDWKGTSNTDIYIGYLFDMEVELPTIYPISSSNNNIISDYTGGLVVHRTELNLGQNAIYEVELERGMKKEDGTRDKTTYSESIGPLTSDTPPVVATDYYTAAYVMPLEEEGQQVIPIYEKNKNLTLTFKSTSPSPATLYSMTWEGDYTNNNYERVT